MQSNTPFEDSERATPNRDRLKHAGYLPGKTTITFHMAKHVIIIGGGVIGTACAHYLLKSGWQVSVIDRGELGRGCSHANCGFVCPSHVLPLGVPGAVGRQFKA